MNIKSIEAQESLCSRGNHIYHFDECSACGLSLKPNVEPLLAFYCKKPSFVIRLKNWLMEELH